MILVEYLVNIHREKKVDVTKHIIRDNSQQLTSELQKSHFHFIFNFGTHPYQLKLESNYSQLVKKGFLWGIQYLNSTTKGCKTLKIL